MQEEVKAISLQASKLSWVDVDKFAMSMGFKDRSKLVQYALERVIFKTKRDLKNDLVVVMLIVLAMLSLAILLKVM